MRQASRLQRSLFPMLLALLAAGSATAGILIFEPSQATAELQPLVAERFEAFPSAATLQARYLAGELEGSHALDADELASLQAALDDLNDDWHVATTLLHARMEAAVEELIAAGMLAPATSRAVPGEEAIGGRLVVHQGVAYEKVFYPGEDERIDTIELRRSMIRTTAEDVIHVFFQ